MQKTHIYIYIYTVIVTAELMSNDTKFALIEKKEEKEETVSYTWSSFACGKENKRKKLALQWISVFLKRRSYLDKRVALRSIVDELTLEFLCLLIYSEITNW